MAQLLGPAVSPALRLRASVEENLSVFCGWCHHGRLWAAVGGGTRTPPGFLLCAMPAGLLGTGGRHRDGAGAADSREPSLISQVNGKSRTAGAR